jgi:nucleobase:cation symporter-1, NCS1 family
LKLGGLVGGVPALLFIILANVGTVLVGVNVNAIGLEQLSWNATTGLALDDSTSGVAKHRHP